MVSPSVHGKDMHASEESAMLVAGSLCDLKPCSHYVRVFKKVMSFDPKHVGQ